MKRLFCAVTTVIAVGSAAPAFAVTVYPTPTPVGVGSPYFTATAGPDGTFTGSFAEIGIAGASGTGAATKGAFAYDFHFQLPANGLGSGAVTTIMADSLATALNLTSVTFNGMDVPISSITGGQKARLDNVPITLLAVNDLIIEGISGGNGSFSGELSFVPSAAPEPGTWAMMILGFGIAGAGLRKRRVSHSLTFA